MAKKLFFVTTRSNSSFYDLINQSLLLHAENKIKKKLQIFYIKKKFPTLSFFIFFIKNLLNIKNLYDENFISLEYRNCSIGRHSFSYAMRMKNSYKNNLFKNFYKIKGLFLGGSIIDTGHTFSKNIVAGYFDHGVYLNGLFIEIFKQKKKIVYTNNFPRGLICNDFKKYNKKKFSYEDCIQINKKKRFPLMRVKNEKRFIKKKITNAKTFEWLKLVNYKKINNEINFKDYDYILYPQGFSDAQLLFGYSGFPTTKDWFEFTLEYFSKTKKKVLIKPHPNFFDYEILKNKNKIRSSLDLAELDFRLYQKFRKNYSRFKNITFLNEPHPNHIFLKKLNNKKQVVLLHHTSAVLECCHFGFKCITSNNFWNNRLKITNVFNSKNHYAKLLSKNFKELKYSNQSDLLNASKQFYLNPYSYFGNKHYVKPIRKVLGFKTEFKFGYENQIKNLLIKNPLKKRILIQKLTKCIQEN